MDNAEKFYPELIFPDSISKALTPPTEPIKDYQKTGEFVVFQLKFVLAWIILFSIGSLIGNALPFILGIIAMIYQYLTYNDHQKAKEKYLNDLNEFIAYKSSLVERPVENYFKVKGEFIYIPRNLFFINKLEKIFEKMPELRVASKTTKTGLTERYFREELCKYMKMEFKDIQYEVYFSPITFYPDLVLKAKVGTTIAYIDIEIDEPYTFAKKPIHCITPKNKVRSRYEITDEYRNSLFLKHDWIIIRFSEEMIINNTKECCKLITSVSRYLFRGSNYEIYNCDHFRKQKWNIEDVNKMISVNYREEYLKSFMQKTNYFA